MSIPDFISHLPVYQGLPVPFTAHMEENGVPDFRVVDHDKKRRCLLEHLCAICGRALGEYGWFIGGPKSLLVSSLFMDPPQHEHCARYAIETCPFLSGKVTETNRSRPVPENVNVEHLVTPTRSDKIGMRRAKAWIMDNVEGYALIRVTRWYGVPIWLA